MQLRHLIFVLLLIPSWSCSHETLVPRTVLALYDHNQDGDIAYSSTHMFLEMPLNHLGYNLTYHDVDNGLPSLEGRDDIIGVLTWFGDSHKLDPEVYLNWAIDAIEKGKKFVVFGHPGFQITQNKDNRALENKFWSKLGLRSLFEWMRSTYQVKFSYIDDNMMNFEGSVYPIKPPFLKIVPNSPQTYSFLSAIDPQNPNTETTLISINSNGGYVDSQYALYEKITKETTFRKWYLNPFLYLRLVFGNQKFPIPDTTTLAGRRLYYSQIDGDGWLNVSDVEKYLLNPIFSSEVIYRDILKPYYDLPTTVGPIGAELDLSWFGTKQSQEIAREIFKLPNVEMGCHTFSHPFDWSFFAHYTPKDEIPYQSLYFRGGWQKKTIGQKLSALYYAILGKSDPADEASDSYQKDLGKGYTIPRAFAKKPFNLNLEIFGAIKVINEFAPPNKRVTIYQWSGDAIPFAAAIKMTEEADVWNINGGQTRFDNEHASYSFVSPLGRPVDNLYQVYASCSNEISYTKGWSGNFYGFNQLPATWLNTEAPRRIKPINLYYHMFSGEKGASLSALIQNIEFARTQQITPVTASHFSAIAQGFRSAEIYSTDKYRWKIKQRGKIQTFRIDQCKNCSIDFSHSKGIIGQRLHQGSLYVYLDEKEKEPEIALKKADISKGEPIEDLTYLIQSRWALTNLQRLSPTHITAIAQGFGEGEMQWKVPEEGTYILTLTFPNGVNSTIEKIASDNLIDFTLDASAIEPVKIEIQKRQ